MPGGKTEAWGGVVRNGVRLGEAQTGDLAPVCTQITTAPNRHSVETELSAVSGNVPNPG